MDDFIFELAKILEIIAQVKYLGWGTNDVDVPVKVPDALCDYLQTHKFYNMII